MDSRQLKKQILYEMAYNYEQKYLEYKRDEDFGQNAMIALVMKKSGFNITKAEKDRFEKILQKIVDNFESKI